MGRSIRRVMSTSVPNRSSAVTLLCLTRDVCNATCLSQLFFTVKYAYLGYKLSYWYILGYNDQN